MMETARLIAALQANSERLISENMLEAWGYRSTADQPLKLSVQHVINPTSDGGYKIRTVIGFGIHVAHRLDADLAANDAPKLSRFPARGNAAAAA